MFDLALGVREIVGVKFKMIKVDDAIILCDAVQVVLPMYVCVEDMIWMV